MSDTILDTECLPTMIDHDGIRRILDHRFPFLMLDRVTSISGDSLEAIKNVSGNELFALGHFPSRPVFPGVLIIEAMAQAIHILYVVSRGLDPDLERDTPRYLTHASVSFLKPVVPGDQMLLQVELTKSFLRGAVGSVKALVDGVPVARGELVVGRAVRPAEG